MKLIIAINKEGYIGLNGALPWRCSADLKHFKEKTLGCKLLVGRTTFETLPPLKNRELLVVGNGYLSMTQALSLRPDWVIGGRQTYISAAEHCTEFHISIINDHSIGDTKLSLDDLNINGKPIFFYYFDPN